MAYFDKRELVDVIRHEIRIEDETGIASKVVRPPSRRAKYGGLPLNFRTSQTDDEDEEQSDTYTIPLYEETNGTRELIATRLRSRTVNSDIESKKENGVHPCPSPAENLFVPVPLPKGKVPIVESRVSKFLQENLEALRNPLNEYAVFEASSTGPNKRILVLLVRNGQEFSRIEISVIPTARVYQVISFCHFKYYQNSSQELPGSIEEYELFMADETGEIDMDFPSLERGRVIGELGFPVLALVRTKDDNDEKNERRVTVYFPGGPSFVIIVPSEDLPFSWLVDEVLRQKEQQEGDLNPGVFRIREFSLESIDQFDVPLDLSKPIGTCGCDEFVMIRKNSSRGDFHPRPRTLLLPQKSQILSPKSPGIPSPRRQSKNIFDFSPMEPATPLTLPNGDKESISCFKVERLHKYKPRWAANLIFHWADLEISPFASESDRRKSFLPSQYQKSIRVSWDFVCDVSMQEKEKGKESAHILTISWLPVPNEPEGNTEITLNTLSQDTSPLNWKSVQVECRSREDAIEIHRYIASVIQSRQSAIQQAWMFSNDGQRRPAPSAEAALAALQSSETASNGGEFPKLKKKGRFRKVARLSRYLMSERRPSTASAVTSPSQMSRHDSL